MRSKVVAWVVAASVPALAIGATACGRRARVEEVAAVPSELRPLRRDAVVAEGAHLFAGGDATCALVAGGGLRCWGNPDDALFGDTAARRGGGAIALDAGVSIAEVAFAVTSSCVRGSDASVKCWGTWRGHREAPREIAGNTYFPGGLSIDRAPVEIAANDRFACARLADETVWCWGDNAFGQLGDDTTTARDSPVEVHGLHDVRQIALGHGHACACKHGGAVWCWGRNEHGQLGNGTTTDSHVPVLVALGEAVQVATGESFSCSRHNDGAVRCWGNGDHAQNGDASLASRLVPTEVTLGVPTAELALGEGHACARGSDGAVRCWGTNTHGELGRATHSAAEASPALVTGLGAGAARAIVAGRSHTCAKLHASTDEGDRIGCWGADEHGQLGDGRTSDSSSAVSVAW